MKEQLREAGLTENEAIIYQTLLHLGPSKAGEIAKKSGLHRRVTYDTLAMLTEKGLISHITQNNTRVFQAANPTTILELLKEKQARIEEILPEMESLFSLTKEKEETNFYKGHQGLKTVMEDQLSTGKNILILGGSSNAYDILQFYFKWFDQRRVKNKQKVKIIFNKTDKKLNVPLSKIRFLPQKYSSPLAVNVYGDKVALILWSKENPFAVVIKNKEISDGYKKYFELMWKSALKI
ncbi:MAG: hypothetical protein KKD18_05685 [Nanoarchaeota archaeon]|nr:hypothetical protein [Nanoarchaeota archaeon]MBU0977881.1 hypothetical protein [Nanoarchaeota archaeon]